MTSAAGSKSLAWVAGALWLVSSATAIAQELPWLSPMRYRAVVEVDPLGVRRSGSPVALEVDFVEALRSAGATGEVDDVSIEVIAHDSLGVPSAFDVEWVGYERYLLPWRLDRLYGATRATLSFVMPSERQTRFAVYFDTLDVDRGQQQRYPGLVGDGDFFREVYQKRQLGASHFDAFADLDRDGDLDLFRGGVEPVIHCLENAGGNRFVERGRLSSAGGLLTLPYNPKNGRAWVVPHFFDLDGDGDGDLDLIPSFTDGPYARQLALFENVTPSGGERTFADRGVLKTVSGAPIGNGGKSGNWFPSVVFVRGFTGASDGGPDLLLGFQDRCLFHENRGLDGVGRWRWGEAQALKAGGEEIALFNPCFAVADVNGDGDLDLFGAPQSGEILFYENLGGRGSRELPNLAKGVVIAYDEVYTLRSTHPRVTVSDFTGDGLLDLAIDRAWELADLSAVSDQRDFGALLKNMGSAAAPNWSRIRAGEGAPHTEGFAICDALRQNVVRARDWDEDGRMDLLAGDCDGFVWLFRNTTGPRAPVFERGRRLQAGGATLSLAASGAHARPDVCDWNNDGRKDLVVSDGTGKVSLFLNEGTNAAPVLAAGTFLSHGEPGKEETVLDRGSRSHVLVCDFNRDGKKDLVFSDQENPGYVVLENHGTDAAPRLGSAKPLAIAPHMRPNLGAFVDWDGDGKRDLVTCEFEHVIRLYRNVGSGLPGELPRFATPEGEPLLRPETIMLISGVDVVDWNGDGDLDILTGQGHGGSGLRFFERDFVEDLRRGTRPRAVIQRVERAEPAGASLLDLVRRYADTMLEHGRDVYGPAKSLLFLSALDRTTLKPLEIRPAPPEGIRREDRTGLPWRKLSGANPHLDQNLLRVLYALAEIIGESKYSEAADHEVKWFFENTQSPATGLLAWGEHLAWDVFLDQAISSSTELTHEFARPWALWARSHDLAPEACQRFALGLWEHQIANHKTGGFDRHALYDRHAPRDGKDFARHAGFYVDTWAHAYVRSKNETLLRAIESLLARFERKRTAPGKPEATFGPLDLASAADLVPEPLAARLKKFAAEEDALILADLHGQFSGPDGVWRFPATWQAGYSSSTTASWAMFAVARYAQTQQSEFRDLIVAVADAYVDALPAEDVDVWPVSYAHVISAEVAAYRLTRKPVYLAEAARLARLAVRVFWQDNPLPRASHKTGHYETITGGDSLALALLEVHAALHGLKATIPLNTIDR